MEMQCPKSQVLACQVQECSYNQSRECHAGKIEIGDVHPSCDTFTTAQVEQAFEDPMVQTCRIKDCKYNTGNDACEAPGGISLGHHSQHADCDTYVPQT